MSALEQAIITPDLIGSSLPVLPQRAAPRPRIGLRGDRHTNEPGRVVIDSMPDHRLLVHVGAPARGVWRSHDVVYSDGDIDLFPAGVSEEWELIDAITALDIRLSPLLLQRAAADMGLDPDGTGLEPHCHFRDAQIEHIAWALDAERQAGYPSGLLYSESLGMALAVHLLGRDTTPIMAGRGLTPAQVRRVTAYIEDHLDDDLSLARLAEVAGVSASHLKLLFRRSLGLPVHAYVVQRRVERAKALLLRGDLPVSQVALEAGFAHQSHMARWMRRLLGVTPTSVMRGAR